MFLSESNWYQYQYTVLYCNSSRHTLALLVLWTGHSSVEATTAHGDRKSGTQIDVGNSPEEKKTGRSAQRPIHGGVVSVEIYIYTIWLVVWNMALIFPYIGNNHPNWPSPSFFRGVGQPVSTTNKSSELPGPWESPSRWFCPTSGSSVFSSPPPLSGDPWFSDRPRAKS